MKFFLVLITLNFVLIPISSYSAWFKLFSSNSADLYLDTSSIIKRDRSIFFSQIVNYKKPQRGSILSHKVYSEINCTNLRIRDLKHEVFKKKMGLGKKLQKNNFNKKWRNTKNGTSENFLNKILCDRIK